MSGSSAYAIRRILVSIPVLLGVSLLIFFSIRLIPGDPARLMAGEDATLEDIERLRRRYGLDRSPLTQYGLFVIRLLQGDLGTSLRTDEALAEELQTRYVNTLALASFSILIAISISIPVGIYSAVRRGSADERFVFLGSLVGIAAPSFWIALMLQLIFSVKLQLLPTTGIGGIRELILPAITVAAYPTASLARQTRAAMLEVLSERYIKMARAKGVGNFRLYAHHALRNALIPVVTLAGYQFARALGGAIIAETVFAYPGLGRYLILSIRVRDYPAIQVTVLLIAVTYIFLTLLTDLVYSLLDPRITYK